MCVIWGKWYMVETGECCKAVYRLVEDEGRRSRTGDV